MFDLFVIFMFAKITNKSIIVKYYLMLINSIGCLFSSSNGLDWYFTLSKLIDFKSIQRILLLYMDR